MEQAPSIVARDRKAVRSALRRNRAYSALWIGQLLSGVGSYSTVLALTLLTLTITGSGTAAGAVATVNLGARVAFRLPGGALVDRFEHRSLMLFSDAIRFVVYLCLALTVMVARTPVALIFTVACVEGLAAAVFNPAEAATVKRVVDDDQLLIAVSNNQLRDYASMLAGPALGGALFEAGHAIPFFVDALSFGFSMIALLYVSKGHVSHTQGLSAALRQTPQIFSAVFRNPFFRRVLLAATLISAAVNAAIFIVPLALLRAGAPPAVVGVAQTMALTGGVAGAALASRITIWGSLRPLLLGVSGSGAVLLVLAAVLSGSLWMALPVAASLFLVPAANAALSSEQLRLTPDPVLGRVSNIVALVAQTSSALAPILAGALIQRAGSRSAMLVFALLLPIAVAICLPSGVFRAPIPLEVALPESASPTSSPIHPQSGTARGPSRGDTPR